MKLKLLILLSMILFISAACTIPGGGGQGKAENNVIGINFVTNLPPQELSEGQSFRVGLNVKNYDTSKKDVLICTWDELGDVFDGIPENSCTSVKLEAAELSGENILPTDQKVYFPDKESFYSYKKLTDNMKTAVFADVSYNHKTRGVAQICIKKDIDTETPGVTCDATSDEEISNNAGPIQISNLKKMVYPVSGGKVIIQLKFDVSNVGSGKVINKNAVKSKEDIEPLINLNVNLLGLTNSFKCNPTKDNKIPFKENQKTIKCESTINLEQDYIVHPVEITIDYSYNTMISTSSISLLKIEGGTKK
ncbi:hypothetical protein J4404_01815 [Candidatus Woesearchaeota archaeon]|nr:hypothetical protein [Candidatus Woesearchaeota archaeon]